MLAGSSIARQRTSNTPVLRRVQRDAPLLLADDEPVAEMDLAEAAAERPGEDPGLERRGARPAVELGAPRSLIGVDPQAKAATDLVARRRRLARTPPGEVVREPEPLVERRSGERVLDLQLVAGAVEDRTAAPRHAAARRSSGRAYSSTNTTSRSRGPWTPSTRCSSMSLVADGPLIHVCGRVGSRRASASGTLPTTWLARTTQM